MNFRHFVMGALMGAPLLLVAPPAKAQQRDVAAESVAPAGEISIAIQNRRLSGSIRNCLLGIVLEQLGSRTGVTLTPVDDIELGSTRVSADLADVPMDEALRQLFKNYDTFFYYGSSGGSAFLRAVWIYRKGAAAALRPVPPEAWAGTRELHASLADADPEVRSRAYEALISRPDRESRDLVIQALRGAMEPDETVRERILSAAFNTGMPLPADVLTDLARWDGSEGIRLMALDALATEPTLKEVARAALTDSSPLVRERARQILTELEPR